MEASVGARVLASWGPGLGDGQVRKALAQARGARGVPGRGLTRNASAKREVERACCARSLAQRAHSGRA